MTTACRPPLILFVLLALLTFCACGDSDKVKKVRLKAVSVPGASEAGAAPYEEPSLTISIAAILSPKLSFANYGELARYLEKRLAFPVKVVFEKNYVETNYALKNSESDIAFICTGGYLSAKEEFKLEVLAVPVVDGKMLYHSLIVARRNGRERGLADLKGEVFAYSDEYSLTGRMYIQARLADLDLNPGFFSDTIITGSHDNSIKAVAENLADAACVNSLVYRVLLARGDPYARQVKVLETSPAFGNPPVVARAGLSPAVKDKLRAIFLNMHRNEEGRRVLRAISVERFGAPSPGLYSSAEKTFIKAAGGTERRK